MKTTSLVVFLLLFFGVVTMSAQEREHADAKQRTVTVRGLGTISTEPDIVRLGVQVNTRGESASAAMNSASARTREILTILKSYSIESKDIQTSRVSVAPILDYQRNIQPPPIVGYTGSNDFMVLFRGKLMDRIGDFMDKAVGAGASGFGGLRYESSRQRDLERDAMKLAASDAQRRAEVLAKELGATLGKVMTINESYSVGMPMGRGVAMTDAMSSAAPVMSGELTISVNIDVVFELK